MKEMKVFMVRPAGRAGESSKLATSGTEMLRAAAKARFLE
jgi:hypothetical protein